jgi:hypothetical protein
MRSVELENKLSTYPVTAIDAVSSEIKEALGMLD